MSNSSVRRVRIGEGRGRIVRIVPDAIEYLDEAGVAHSIDPATCNPSATGRTVGLRGSMDSPPWFEFFGPHAVRMEFDSDQDLYRQLVVPLAKAGYASRDGC